MVILPAVAVLAIPICGVFALSCGLLLYLGLCLRVGLRPGEGQPDERPCQLPWVWGAAADAAGS